MAVAANSARKAIQLTSSVTRTVFSHRSLHPIKLSGFPSSPHKHAFSFSRLPVQLVGAQLSLTPLHSATASALFTSLLSLHNTNWGCLSEGALLKKYDRCPNVQKISKFRKVIHIPLTVTNGHLPREENTLTANFTTTLLLPSFFS
ncbi:unnamed protein product [Sphenostylis stenocarpa]|uniref:Uncharacterized protein n=1 Tax=Sphenostylis stenocarpa TaxID=92480 RepID=A0AA86V992_9FABA|nr:unnamed protein product [Sphenostylis stenocarpa]